MQLAFLATLLAHVQPAINQHLQVLFHQASFWLLCCVAWGGCDPSAGPGTCPCWISYDWHWPINPACPGPSLEPPSSLADQHSFPTWCICLPVSEWFRWRSELSALVEDLTLSIFISIHEALLSLIHCLQSLPAYEIHLYLSLITNHIFTLLWFQKW